MDRPQFVSFLTSDPFDLWEMMFLFSCIDNLKFGTVHSCCISAMDFLCFAAFRSLNSVITVLCNWRGLDRACRAQIHHSVNHRVFKSWHLRNLDHECWYRRNRWWPKTKKCYGLSGREYLFFHTWCQCHISPCNTHTYWPLSPAQLYHLKLQLHRVEINAGNGHRCSRE